MDFAMSVVIHGYERNCFVTSLKDLKGTFLSSNMLFVFWKYSIETLRQELLQCFTISDNDTDIALATHFVLLWCASGAVSIDPLHYKFSFLLIHEILT